MSRTTASRTTCTARRPSRPAAVLLVAAALLTGCSVSTSGASPTGDASGTPSERAAASASPTSSATGAGPSGAPAAAEAPATTEVPAATGAPVTLPAAPAWSAGPGEVQPEVKLAATRFVELAGTWAGQAGSVPEVEQRLAAAGLPPGLASAVAPLADDAAVAASVEVVYPQYGGLTDDLASVMVVLRQQLLPAGGPATSREVILDVRLRRGEDGGWAVTGVDPGLPLAPDRPPTPLAEQVLANPAVRLPGPARADILAGRVEDPVLAVLQELARDHVVDVLVTRSGHPTNVFDTDRVSNHTIGRAVDLWRIDDQLVVDPGTPRELLSEVMLAAGRAGATEVGGPFDLNGEGRGFFTDPVHADHLHLGVTPGRPPAVP